MEDIKTIIWALEHYDFKLDCVPEKVVNMINELLNGYKKLQQENQQYKNAWGELENMFINHIDAKAMNYQDNKLNPNEILNKMQELEQKYNLGGE